MIVLLQKFARLMFGEFETEEFKKFLRMGGVFAFIIASFCALCPIKNSLFCIFVGPDQIPYVKTLSLLILVPLIILYGKLLDLYGREKTFYLLSMLYGITACMFAAYYFFTNQQAQITDAAYTNAYYLILVVNYLFYVWVESYGALMVALFWAISTDITTPNSAKKGFPLIVTMGQLGGMIGPFFIAGLPCMLGHATSTISIVIVVGAIFVSIYLLRNLLVKTPAHLLIAYHGSNEKEEEKKQESGFFEGVYLLLRHAYLLGIFAVVAFPEIIMTFVDLRFNTLASELYGGMELIRYHSYYTSAVSLVTLLLLLGGASRITTLFGLGVSLFLVPVLYGIGLLGLVSFDSLHFLFLVLVISKAVNHALNGPAIKQLYIPTTHDVRFKSQAWIEIFGFRGSRTIGSLFGMLLGTFQTYFGQIVGRARHALLMNYLSLVLIFMWFFIAIFLGKKHRTAVAEKKVVC